MPIFDIAIFDPAIFDTGGGGGSTPTPLTYGSYLWANAPFSSTITFTGMTIGAAASDRWVIAAMHLEHADANIITSVTIGGVSATRLYGALSLSIDGIRFEFWAANVPTGTTATVVATTPGTFYEGSCATYYCAGEPTFHDGASDIVYTGSTFSVAINVPDGGAVIAAVSNENAGVLSSWVGVTADATDETEETYFASEDQMAVETGRTVSFTSTATSTATRFFGLGVVSVAIPLTGGGGVDVTVTPTVGSVTVDGLAPTVERGAGATPDAGSVTVTGLAPDLSVGSDLTIGLGSITIDGLAPDATGSATSTTATGSVTVDGLAPDMSFGSDLTPDVGSVTITGLAPDVTAGGGVSITPDLGQVNVTGLAPTLELWATIDTLTGSVVVGGLAPDVSAGSSSDSGTGSVIIAGIAPTVDTGGVGADPGKQLRVAAPVYPGKMM